MLAINLTIIYNANLVNDLMVIFNKDRISLRTKARSSPKRIWGTISSFPNIISFGGKSVEALVFFEYFNRQFYQLSFLGRSRQREPCCDPCLSYAWRSSPYSCKSAFQMLNVCTKPDSPGLGSDRPSGMFTGTSLLLNIMTGSTRTIAMSFNSFAPPLQFHCYSSPSKLFNKGL